MPVRDAASIRTRGERDGAHYVLNGSKRYITNAPSAGAFTCDGANEPEGKGARRRLGFHRARRLPGLSLGKPDHKMGQRGTKTCDVSLDNVRLRRTSSAVRPAKALRLR